MPERPPETLWGYITRSTMKREFASFSFFTWIAYFVRLCERTPTTQFTPDAALVAWAALGPFQFALVMAAFGTDWVSKQTTIAGPPMNTEIKTTTEIDEGKATSTTSSETKP